MDEPSVIVEQAKKKEEERKKILVELEAMKVAVNSAATDPNVAFVLKWLSKKCGIEAPVHVVGNQGEVQVSSTIFNVGRLSVYQDIRRLMSIETINVVERSE